jgi:hypothetical protein
MTRDELELLTTVRIVNPCPMRWSELDGDDRKRFCGQCRQHVYRLSELRTDEVLTLVRASKTERVCAQLVYRLDGTVLTKDCASAWSVGVSHSVRHVGSVVSVTSMVGFGLVMLVALAFALVTLFGDNVRAYFGAAAGGIGGSGVVTRRTHAFVSMPPTLIETASPNDAVNGLPREARVSTVRAR